MQPQIAKLALLLAIATPLAYTLTPDAKVVEISQDQLARVFDAEKATLTSFAKELPMVETYLQSLYPDPQSEAPIDDAYFLGRVELNPDSSSRVIKQTLLVGNEYKEERVRVVNGQHWSLDPNGFVEMLFPDARGFERDYYELTFKDFESLGRVNCLRISVKPRDVKEAGDFTGEIWVETSHFHIVRAKGTFTPKRLGFVNKYFSVTGIAYSDLFLHFDSWRQETSPGIWLPAYTYFDESETWANKTGGLVCSFHWRGHVSVWGYNGQKIDRKDTVAAIQRLPRTPDSLLAYLYSQDILATPGEIEASLNDILRELRTVNGINGLEVDCRILLTTPVELFSVANTVVISRGLLNLVPDRSVLTALLATELAHIVLDHSGRAAGTSNIPSSRNSDFKRQAVRRSAADRDSDSSEASILLNHPQYAEAIPAMNGFISQLAQQSSQIPNLLRARFGFGFISDARGHRGVPSRSLETRQAVDPLQLHETYAVLPSLDRIAKWGNDDRLDAPSRRPLELVD